MSEEGRIISPHRPKSDDFPPNEVRTSRYTLITFLPKCLFEQFRRLANVYFVVLGIIAAVGYYGGYYEAAVEPAAILAPVSIVVMISVIKEGVEDIKRHQADTKVNARPVKVVGVDGTVTSQQWKDLLVGSIVLLQSDEEIPADIVVLAAGGIQGNTAYVETAAIDGETNLKVRAPGLMKDTAATATGVGMSTSPLHTPSPKATTKPSDPYDKSITVSEDRSRVLGVTDLNISLSVEAPNSSIHHFDGSMEFTDDQKVNHRATLTEKNILLRGAVVRATGWCVGIVAYTGKHTKLSLNSRNPPSKLSAVDRVVNKSLAVAIGVMIVVCFISMLFSLWWTSQNSGADYLCLKKDSMSPPYSSTNGGGCSSAAPSSILTIFTFATLYNNFVCISMYVSLEMVYLCQSFFLQNDLDLYDESTDTPAECHTSGMCADIGQIQYVLSDKTGTLTKNLMTLRRCSVAGLIYGAPIKPPDVQVTEEDVVGEDGDEEEGEQGVETRLSFEAALKSAFGEADDKSHVWYPLNHMAHHRLKHPLGEANAKLLMEYMWNITVCNTVMLMPNLKTGSSVNITDFQSLKSCLQAESPEEVALVLAAAEYSNELLLRRDVNETVVRNMDQSKDLSFKILAVNEFDSDRKRMSILVRRSDNVPVLYCKGADSCMLPYCRESAHTSICMKHIEQFAVTGLRTLVMAKRELQETEVVRWLAKHKEASNNIGRRKEMLYECALEIEKEMDLLGAVGIEDELQDGVAQAIQALQRAGLNVWMITGDKPETAVAISQMCSLLRSEHRIHEVVGVAGEALEKRILDIQEIAKAEIARMKVLQQVGTGDVPVHPWVQLCKRQWERVKLYFFPPKASAPSAIGKLSRMGTKRRSTIGGVETGALALVIDGTSLEGVWENEKLRQIFTGSIEAFPTVVACRVSPLQKASLVKMVKNGAGQPITLAIGDGANDVGMIQESRVGVGISGREGRHAANSADFAIGQFRFLVPLLLHHGRFNYIRCSKLVLYSFFKNLVLVSILFYYSFYSGFSGTIPLDSFVISGYNFYLGLPIIALGALDFDCSKADVMLFPKLAYNTGRLGELLNNANMMRWCITAFVFGMMFFGILIRFFTAHLTTNDTASDGGYLSMTGVGFPNSMGQDGGIYNEGFVIFTTVIVAMQYKVMLMTKSITWINWTVWWLSFLGYLFFVYVYGLVPTIADWYHVVNFSFGTGQFWLAVFMVPILFVMMDWLLEKAMATFFPSSNDALIAKLQEHRRQEMAKTASSQNKTLGSATSPIVVEMTNKSIA